MDLFSLVASLTLDASDFNTQLDEAKSSAEGFDMPDDPEMGLDTDEFEDNLEQAEDSAGGAQDSIITAFDNIKKALMTAGIAGILNGIVSSLKEAINLTAQNADTIDKGSQALGISAEAYQRWNHAMMQSGSNVTDLSRGIRNMNSYIAEGRFADATDDMSRAFADLGISVTDANGKIKTTEELVQEALLALSDLPQDATRANLAERLFGKGSTGLNALLNSTREGVEGLLNEADELGLVMTDDEIKNAVAYGDAVANLNAELTAIKEAFVADIIPVLKEGTEWLTSLLSTFNPRLREVSLSETFEDIDKRVIASTAKINKSKNSAKQLIEELQALGDYWSLDEEGKMTWDALAERALELFPQLSKYIDTDGHIIRGNTQDIEANIDAWARLEKQRLLSSAMNEKSEAVAEQLVKAYDKGAEASTKMAEAEGNRLATIEKANELLKSQGMEQLSTDASYEDIIKARDALVAKAGSNVNAEMHVRNNLDEYVDMYEEAQKLQTESEKMIAEAEQAQDNLDEYEMRLAEQMGLTQEEVQQAKSDVEELRAAIESIPEDAYTKFHISTDYEQPGKEMPKAIGDHYIPYDNFPALLHRGERVLTATENRRGAGEGSDTSGLQSAIVAAVREGMAGAQVNSYLDGKAVTDAVNRRNTQDIKARRYAP